MKDLLKKLESKISPYGESTTYAEAEINCFPEFYIEIFDFKIFGQNVLAVPEELDSRYADEENWERPFFFDFHKLVIENGKIVNGFINEIKELKGEELDEINGDDFIKIGGVYSGEIFVFLNINKMSIHTFHIADAAVEEDYLLDILNSRGIDFKSFIKLIKPQTVCYLESTENRSLYAKYEIRDNKNVRYEIYKEDKTWDLGIKTFNDKEEALKYYKESIASFVHNGYKLNFGPKFIIETLI